MAGPSSDKEPSNQLGDPPTKDPTSKQSKTSWMKLKTAKLFRSKSPDVRNATSSGSAPTVTKISAATAKPHIVQNAQSLLSRPIAELWDEAYDELALKEKSLIADYEAELSNSLAEAVIQSSAVVSTSLQPVTKIQRYERMSILLRRKIEEVDQDVWKLKLKGHELAIKDLVEPVVGVIDWAKEYIGNALESSTYGSIAWVGVCLLLPLLLNPSKQDTVRIKALENIASLVSRCRMREILYHRRYESTGENKSKQEFTASHIGYRESLKSLYLQILKFQAASVVFFSRNSLARIAGDVVKWDNWDVMLAEIKEQEKELTSLEEIFRDTRYQEECQKQIDRHQQRIAGLRSIEIEVARVSEVIKMTQKNSERRDLLTWLSSVDPSANYNSARRSHAISTGDWLVRESRDFKIWKAIPNSLLWLHGKVGAGKSFLSSSVIDHLQKAYDSDPYTATAYFYFSFSDREKQNTENMLRSLIVQLCGRRPDTPKSLLDLRRYRDINHQPDLDKLKITLRSCMEDFTSVYIVLDALDECPTTHGERDKLLETLGHIHEWNLTNVRVLYTSRRETDIKIRLAPMFSDTGTIIIDLEKRREEVNKDIRKYIDQKISSSHFHTLPPETKANLKTALTEKAGGMFQYVALQLKALENARSPYAIAQALKDLPNGLDDTYNRALLSMDASQQSHAIRCLKWLSFSIRPITLSELAEVAIIDPEHPPFNPNMKLYHPRDVLHFLPGLVTVYEWEESMGLRRPLPETEQVIRLAHMSVREYLMSDQIKNGPAAMFSINEIAGHIHIARSCLVYHLYASQNTKRMDKYSFHLWKYATRSWIEHVQSIPREGWPDSLLELIKRILEPQSDALLLMMDYWLSSKVPNKFSLSPRPKIDLPTRPTFPDSIYYTAYWAYFQHILLSAEQSLESIDLNWCQIGKPLNTNDHQLFMRHFLGILGYRPHDRLIELLTWHHRSLKCCYWYPSGDVISLWDYWEDKQNPRFDKSTVLWSLDQLKGIMSAVHMIHDSSNKHHIPLKPGSTRDGGEWYCHQLDINPRNIVWVNDGSGINNGGTLKFLDFGLNRFHTIMQSLDGAESHAKLEYQIAYQSPEWEFLEHSSCPSDIFILGILYLDFILWLLEGRKGVEEFYWSRYRTDPFGKLDELFYSTIDDNGPKAIIRDGVFNWDKHIHANEKCSAVIHDIVDLIMGQVLIVDPTKRIDSKTFLWYLTVFFEKAERDQKYLLDPVPRSSNEEVFKELGALNISHASDAEGPMDPSLETE